MTPSRIERLLERMVEQNDELISGIRSLQDRIDEHARVCESRLSDMAASLESVHGELNWAEELSLGRVILDRLDKIESATDLIGDEVTWSKELSLGGELLERLDNLNEAVQDVERAVNSVETAIDANG